MSALNTLLLHIMDACYALCGNYGLAIVLFTFFSKIILLPVTVWTYFNSIKMIKIQPDINELHIKYYGQRDRIADEQATLFQKEGYHPLLSVVPLIVQLILLIGVVAVIREGIADPHVNMAFGPVDLGRVPAEAGWKLLYAPILAALSAWLLAVTQNADNVLQAEQSKLNQYGTMIFSVLLSLYLGWFVPVGVAWYWVLSNLMSIVLMYLMNLIIKPRQYVDYERLEKSRQELKQLRGIGNRKHEGFFSEHKRREREDYKRFFSVINKHLVFYSESSGFYKYYQAFIEYLFEHTNITVHYITSDPDDQVFAIAKQNPQMRAYYIGENRLITLMMKMDADIVVMTMPDLEQFHIKRSYVRKDIEYLYIQHGIGSANIMLRKGALDHYDTVFCTGQLQKQEIIAMEEYYHLPKKKLLEIGYPLIEDLLESAATYDRAPSSGMILIAPSWQPDNIIDSCLAALLDELRKTEWRIIVRPHPQETVLKRDFLESLSKQYSDERISFQLDFTSDNPLMEADILITDWSNICFEFALATHRPVLFIDTPMKVMNPEWEAIKITPLEIAVRNRIGKSIRPDEIADVNMHITDLIDRKAEYYDKIEKLMQDEMYNIGTSAEKGAMYIAESIREKIAAKKKTSQTGGA